jgi:hypothetical protein
MSVFEEMHPGDRFESLRDYNELKRMLSETIERGFVEEVPVMITRTVPMVERWYRDKETGEIYSLIPPEAPSRGAWERVELKDLERSDYSTQ